MKKRFLSFLLIPLILTACSNQGEGGEEPDKLQTGSVKDTALIFQSDYEKCKNKDYANLDFSGSGLILPETDHLCDLKVTANNRFYSTEEMLVQFQEYCKLFFDEYDSSKALFAAYSSEIPEEEGDGKYAWYPKADDYLEELQSGVIEADMFMYRDIENEHYLWWLGSSEFPHWINKGEAYSFAKTDETRISSWLPSDMDSKTASYINNGEHDNEAYRLLDGDVTVGEAVKYFENDYLSSLPFKIDENYSVRVSSIDVYGLKDGLYCYVFNFSCSWKGIAFDGRVESTSYEDPSHQYKLSGEALMIKKGEIDTAVNLIFPPAYEEKTIENIFSLEKAADTVSEKLSKGVVFEVQTVSLVYKGDYNDDFTAAFLEPEWKFITYNPNDGTYYDVYVNAETGKCSYVAYIPVI